MPRSGCDFFAIGNCRPFILLAVLLFCLSYFSTPAYSQGVPIEQLKKELGDFFNETYIAKFKSIFDPKTKNFKTKGIIC